MQTVKLKNGTTELDGLVAGTMLSLKSLFDTGLDGLVAVYELNEKCKNPEHKIFSGYQTELLQRKSLLDSDGKVHQSIKNIVLSAVQEENSGFRHKLSLGNPYASEADL